MANPWSSDLDALNSIDLNTGSSTDVPVTTAVVTAVASSATNVTLLALHATRRMASIFNDSTSVLYVKMGATASSSSYTVRLAAGDFYEFPLPVYTGRVDGIWASANGNAVITELTP